jgi:hypothetical protein
MIRPRFKRNERIHEIALRSDWTFSAKLSLGGLLILVVIVPLLLAGKPEFEALARTTRFLGWVFSISFACIGAYRYFVQRRQAGNPPPLPEDRKDAE